MKRAQSNGLDLKRHWQDALDSDPPSAQEMVINESWQGVWRLWRPRERSIPEGARIHASALRLMETPGNRYRPRNLPNPDRYQVVET